MGYGYQERSPQSDPGLSELGKQHRSNRQTKHVCGKRQDAVLGGIRIGVWFFFFFFRMQVTS